VVTLRTTLLPGLLLYDMFDGVVYGGGGISPRVVCHRRRRCQMSSNEEIFSVFFLSGEFMDFDG
jgi:hypothetical protein